MVGHRLPKKIDNRSQAEKDKERDILISASKESDLYSRLVKGVISMPDVFGIIHILSCNVRAVNCCRVDGYILNRFESEALWVFFGWLNKRDLMCAGLEAVIDSVTSNFRQKPKWKGYFMGLVTKGFLREFDYLKGTRYVITDEGWSYLTRYMYYMVGFCDQANQARDEAYLHGMKAMFKASIRAVPKRRQRVRQAA